MSKSQWLFFISKSVPNVLNGCEPRVDKMRVITSKNLQVGLLLLYRQKIVACGMWNSVFCSEYLLLNLHNICTANVKSKIVTMITGIYHINPRRFGTSAECGLAYPALACRAFSCRLSSNKPPLRRRSNQGLSWIFIFLLQQAEQANGAFTQETVFLKIFVFVNKIQNSQMMSEMR